MNRKKSLDARDPNAEGWSELRHQTLRNTTIAMKQSSGLY
jgi:hypothetical protein